MTLQGFGLGVGGSIGDRDGSSSNRILPTYVTPGQQAFFTYASNAYANGVQWRVQPQAYWYSGNKGLLAEYAISDQNVAIGATKTELQNTAWNLQASYVLTGEDVNYVGAVKPAHDFKLSERSWGAWELIARIGGLKIDKEAFTNGLAVLSGSSLPSAKSATSYDAGINWYISENLKFATNYSYTEFKGGGASVGTNRPTEQVVQSRLQFRF